MDGVVNVEDAPTVDCSAICPKGSLYQVMFPTPEPVAVRVADSPSQTEAPFTIGPT